VKAEAIAKLKKEMDGETENPYVQLIGKFLISKMDTVPDACSKIMAADKSIVKSIDAMAAEAKKKQRKGMAMLGDIEGLSIVLNYFEIESRVSIEDVAALIGIQAAPATPVPMKPKPSSFDVKLEDFGL